LRRLRPSTDSLCEPEPAPVRVPVADEPTLTVLKEVQRLPFPAFLVGGTVRDLLIRGLVQDVDVVVRGSAAEAARILASRLQGTCFQMHPDPLTFRTVADNSALPHVDLLELKGGDEPSEDLVARDLSRRDFTINAMAAKLLSLTPDQAGLQLLDPCGGSKDLAAGIVRPVSDTALSDDPVRMLRCFRLAAELGFEIAPEALQAVARHHARIHDCASERIRDELLLLLDVTPCLHYLELALRAGLLHEIIPELAAMRGVRQDGYHHLDVHDHTIEALRQLEQLLADSQSEAGCLIGRDLMAKARAHLADAVQAGVTRKALLKLGALLHDIAKPQTRTVEADGRTRFIGHNSLGAEAAREVGRRLRLGRRATEMLAKMVREHMRPGVLASELSPTERAINRFLSQMADLAVEVLLLELSDRLASRGPATRRVSVEKHAQFTESLLATYFQRLGQSGPPRLLDGNEVMARFRIRPGPLVGHLLAIVLEAQQEGRITTKEAALALLDRVFPSVGDEPPGHVE